MSLREFASKIVFLLAAAVLWEVVRLAGHYPELLLPGIGSVIETLWYEKEEILNKTLFSLRLIGSGLFTAVILAMIGTVLSMSGKFFAEIITNIMAIMHPLPGIAILPVAILWLG